MALPSRGACGGFRWNPCLVWQQLAEMAANLLKMFTFLFRIGIESVIVFQAKSRFAWEGQMANLIRQLDRYRLTTAEILYHLPDHPSLLQSYTWQDYDLTPDFPVLRRFLAFWERSIEGKLHSVKVASTGIISAGEIRHTGAVFTLH
jgi:uncharacterized protein Usg